MCQVAIRRPVCGVCVLVIPGPHGMGFPALPGSLPSADSRGATWSSNIEMDEKLTTSKGMFQKSLDVFFTEEKQKAAG